MALEKMNTALATLRWTLGLVILIEAILFVMPSARAGFAGTHMPDALRQILGWGEIIGAVLLLIPKTAVRGAWLLIVVFILAIAVHLLHGMFNVGNLAIYAAAAWATAAYRA
jgi:uncharacterized membrane protein YphA (DoxX/SURF4 family)